MIKSPQYLVGTFILLLSCLVSHATIIHVDGSKNSKSIKESLADAAPYDTIMVAAGVYFENTILIDKPITLIGKDNPVLDANHEKVEILLIASDHVHVSGFTFRNVAISYLKDLAAVKVRSAKHGSISNNILENCFFGIYLGHARNYVVSNNVITGAFKNEASAGNAIHVWKAKHIEISGNTLSKHRDGIYFEFVDSSTVSNNNSFNNMRYGLHFMFSNDDVYNHNTFMHNGSGVAVMFSRRVEMTRNTFVENKGGASYGLLLKEISDGTISQNTFLKNTRGVLAEGANRLIFKENQFTSNGTAIDMKGNSLDNVITQNNFLANTFEIVTNSNHNINTYDSNYWSMYSGYDLNRDGIGDLPYRPVNLFARITNEIPAATLMLHSVFVNMLDATERIFPDLIPAELVDENPMMKPYVYDFDK